jgi:hypothetical protein
MFLGMMRKTERVVQGERRIEVVKSRFLVLGTKKGVVRRFVRMRRVILMKSILEIKTVGVIMILDDRRGVLRDVLD